MKKLSVDGLYMPFLEVMDLGFLTVRHLHLVDVVSQIAENLAFLTYQFHEAAVDDFYLSSLLQYHYVNITVFTVLNVKPNFLVNETRSTLN